MLLYLCASKIKCRIFFMSGLMIAQALSAVLVAIVLVILTMDAIFMLLIRSIIQCSLISLSVADVSVILLELSAT